MDEISTDAENATDGAFSSESTAESVSTGVESTETATPEPESRPVSRRAALSAALKGGTPSAPAAKPVSDQPGDKGIEAASPPIERPKSWSKEASESWSSLPRNVQELIFKRESEREKDYTSKTEQLAREREEFGRQQSLPASLYRTLEPHLQDFHLRGVDPHAWLNEVIAIDKMARQDKAAAARHLLQAWRLTPAQLAQAQAQGQNQAFNPQLQQVLNPVVQEVQRLKQQLSEREKAEIQARQQGINREVEAFKSAKGENGEPLRPHFETVSEDMAEYAERLSQANPQKSLGEVLQEAYDRAIWAHPEVRKQILEAEQKQKEEREREDAAKRVADAKKASTSIVGSPNGKTIPTGMTRREQIAAEIAARA